MTKRTGAGLLAFGLLFSFFIYSHSTPAQAALTEQQIQAVTSLLSSFGANPDIVANVTAALSGQETGSSAGTQNQRPIGYAGNIRGGTAHGWTLDPDEPSTKIGFHVYMDGEVGKGGTYVAGGRAGFNRADITPAKDSYGHWYEFVIPDEYRDGKDHTLYVYGIDTKGASEQNNTLLKNNPKSFNIAPGSVPPLFLPGDRVKTKANLNARATPSTKGAIVGEEPKGSLGTIANGPTNAGGYTWWQIDWDNNLSGWSADTYLVEFSTPPSEDPSCTLTANPTSITTGNSSTLSWTSTDATSGTIDNAVGVMTPIASGSKSVSPTASTTYTATVTGGGKTATCEASVDVTTSTTMITSCGEITSPGAYTLANDISRASGTESCISILDTSNVTLDCNSHSITGNGSMGALFMYRLQDFTIKNCTLNSQSTPGFTIVNSYRGNIVDNTIRAPGSVQGPSAELTVSRNAFTSPYGQSETSSSTISNNTFDTPYSAIISTGGRNNKILNNIIDGKSNGVLSDYLGADDGIILGSHTTPESDDLVSGNVISNVYDCGIETSGIITNTIIENNDITNTGYCGIGGWYNSSWKGNIVRNNIVKRSPALFVLQLSWVQDFANTIYLKDNTFTNNKLQDAKTGVFPQSSYFNINPGTALPPNVQLVLQNNVIKDNDFGTLSSPLFYPFSMIVDGGGNICKSTGETGFPLTCTASTFSPGDRVQTTAILNIRATPSYPGGTIVWKAPKGAQGTIIGGPTITGSYTWWQVDWDSNISGWGIEPYLAKVITVPDTTPPTVSLTAPAGGATVSGNVTISATASDPSSPSGQTTSGMAGVQFKVDGINIGAEDIIEPYTISWDTTTATNGAHTVQAVAHDAAGNTASTTVRSVTVGKVAVVGKKGGALANSRMQGYSYTATDILNALNVPWYYNWRIDDQIHANGVFVPMVWRQDTIDEAESIYASSSEKFPILLAFNEPNNPGMADRNPPQALLTPELAASYWDRLTAISTHISAPAPSDGPNGGADGSWLDAFMKLTADKGKRVDFMTLHWYGPPDATEFLNQVDLLWNKYHRPIWITEFAVKDPPGNPNKYTEDDVISFMRVALRGLEDRQYVERYAWFETSGSAGDLLDQSTLFDETSGQLTKVGKFYAAWNSSPTTLFSPGDRIQTTANLNVRATPSSTGTKVGTEPRGSLGTIVSGPIIKGNTWWQINWDNLLSGWSIETYLAKVTTPPPPPPPPPSADIITVSGNKILKNGTQFIMKGVVFESFQYTDADLAVCSAPNHPDRDACQKRKDGRDYYFGRGAFTSGNDVFSVLPQWGANTIRFNLGQAQLDPQSPYYDTAYVQMVADAVKRARDRGYVVIFSPFAGRNDNAGAYLNSHNPLAPLDTDSTLRANETLAGLFKNDRGVLFETLNEPTAGGATTASELHDRWILWRDGNGGNFVGVNAVISAIRATGAKNVVIAQGIGKSFEGFPGGVIDSAGQLAYAVHPFLNSSPNASDWGPDFGTFATTHPFLITAWGSNTNDPWCANTATDIGLPLAFLNYLKNRNIGLAGWAFDSHGAGSITKRDFYIYPGAPSVLGTDCGDNGGVGTLVQQYFLGTLPPPAPAFSPGDRVKTTANLNVRATPSATAALVGKEPIGSLGTIVSGPIIKGNTWWQINWDNLLSGWSIETYLAKATRPPPPPPTGIIYVFAGQSNMIGAGTDISQLAGRAKGDTLPGVQIWNNQGNTFENIKLGINTVQWPQLNQTTFDKFGTEWAVAEKSSAQSIPTYIVKVARGATSLLVDTEWNPSASDNLTTKLINAVNGAKSASGSSLKCFVWIQGEADRGKTARLTEYSNNLKEVVSRVRTAGGNSTAQIAVVELSHRADGLSVSETNSFRAMQQAFVAADPRASLIDTDDLTKVDNVHYDTVSIMTLGNRIYNACNGIPNPITPTIEGPAKSAVDDLKGWTVTGGDPSSTFTINWGDGTNSSQTKTLGEKVWHTYRSAGTYTLTAEVTRPGGAKVTAQTAVAVTPLQYFFCDIKRPVALREWTLSSGNYKQVIDAFKSELGCNGIRFGIDSKTPASDVAATAPDSSPEGYTQLYRDAYAYARQKGLLIYANLLPEPDTSEYSSTTKQAMINLVSAYTNHFCPDFLGPFNENPGFTGHSEVVNGVRAQMTSSCTDPAGNSVKAAKIVAPDSGGLAGVKKTVSGDPAFLGTIDIFSSHNNTGGDNVIDGGKVGSGDRSMTAADWQDLRRVLGGGKLPTWASEAAGGGPILWDEVPFAGKHQGEQVGVKAIIDSGVVSGLVLYMAPRLLVESGGTYTLTGVGMEIAQGLCDAGWSRSCPQVLGASTTKNPSLLEGIWSYITGTLGAAATALLNFPF